MMALGIFSFSTLYTGSKTVKVSESTITWKGYKIGGEHSGSIKLTSGMLDFKRGKLTGGTFKIDMTSIAVTDLKGSYKEKLEGHLKSDDFFGVSKYPEATLVFTEVQSIKKGTYRVLAKLTLKGITKELRFDMKVDATSAETSLKIDRTKFGVRYGSASFFNNLKDKAIRDEFDLTVRLVF